MISIIVPNFNHLKFLPQRLDTIFNQTFQDYEIILLDDCSTDGSWQYLKEFENLSKVSHCKRNEVNSGSPFKQWKKGIELSKGDLIWIAESDDWSDLTFLENCVSHFDSSEVGMVMAASRYVDNNNQVLEAVPFDCPSGYHNGIHFVRNHMYFRNQILNASGVIFRKSYVNYSILDRIGEYRLSGDHLFWTALMRDSNVVILPNYLNYFRWHQESVRNQELKKLTGLKEGIKIKLWLEEQFEIDGKDKSRREAYLNYFKFLKQYGLSKNWEEFLEISAFFSPMDKIKAFIRFMLFS